MLQAAATITITSREVELDERRTRSDVTDATDAGQRALEAPRLAGPSATVAPLQVPTPVAPTATSIATTTTTVAAPPPRPQASPPPVVTPTSRLEAAYVASVPAAWRSTIHARLEIIRGSTSWAHTDGRIQVGQGHMADDRELRATLAHEFGHLIAYRYGAKTSLGAPPRGWPSYSSNPQEAWADCVSIVFTGINDPSHGLPPCAGESLSWARSWLAAGPP